MQCWPNMNVVVCHAALHVHSSASCGSAAGTVFCCTKALTCMQNDDFTLNLGSQVLGELQKIEIGFASQQTMAGKAGGLFGLEV